MANMDKLHDDVAQLKKKVEKKLDSEAVRERLDVSHFGPNAILRGIQLTFVGGEFPSPSAQAGRPVTRTLTP